jgi:putative nucleotide binding protein
MCRQTVVLDLDKKYEDHGIVLDFLPQGHPDDRRPIHLREPLAQILGDTFFTLLEVVPNEGTEFSPHDRVFIGKGERKQVERVKRRIGYDELSAAAKSELVPAVEELIDKDPERFLEFFNKAGPVTSRFHQLELIPGIGKKLMWAILEERKKAPFKDFKDLNKRLTALPHPKRMIAKRIEMELQEADKYSIFARRPSRERLPRRHGGGAGPSRRYS